MSAKGELPAFDEIETLLARAYAQDRSRLYEHEIYSILDRIGLMVPVHFLITHEDQITPDLMFDFTGGKVVLKAAYMDIVHKQKAGAVQVVIKDLEFVRYSYRRMKDSLEAEGYALAGILLVEFIEYSQDLGNETLLGFRESDAFGPVVSFSKGGSDAEHFARHFSPPNLIPAPMDEAWAKALLYSTHIQKKFEEQGKDDYTDKIIRAGMKFGRLAAHFSNFFKSGSAFAIREFEVNPFIFDPYGRFIALDGYAVFEPKTFIDSTLSASPETLTPIFNPTGVAVVGVSRRKIDSPGTIIAKNLMAMGRQDVCCINPKGDQIVLAGKRIPVYNNLASVPAVVELAVVSVPAEHVLSVVSDCAAKGVKSVILIPGGFSETGRGEDVEQQILAVARQHGMRLLGPNCLGVMYAGNENNPGINTFFIPEDKLRIPAGLNRNVALLSQSGALGLTELHNLRHGISPRAVVSYGNQLDIDPSDLIAYFSHSEEIDVIGCYIEGFKPGAGKMFCKQAGQCKKPVIVYKAGRTEVGRKATESHTASIAGEYVVAQAAMKQAGVVLAESVTEHNNLLKIFALLNDFTVTGNRVAIIANAGYEKTYAADNLGHLAVAQFDESTKHALEAIIPPMVNAEPLLDLTPMADDHLFEQSIETVLSCDKVDALFVSIVPHTPALHTTDAEMAADHENVAVRIVRQAHKHKKPIVVSICLSAGSDVVYNSIGRTLEEGGVPTFLSASQAMKCLNAFIRYWSIRKGGDLAEWLK